MLRLSLRRVRQVLDGGTRQLLTSRLANGTRYKTNYGYPTLDEFHRKLPKSKRIRPVEEAKTRISKTLSALLRHGDRLGQLPMRKDGYVAVKDLVSSRLILCRHAMTIEISLIILTSGVLTCLC